MDKKEKILLNRVTIGVFLLVSVGTIFYHFQEGFSWLDSFYFTIITLTTVGYGDLSPQTDLGKAFTILFVLSGIGLLGMFISTWTSSRMNRKADKILETKKKGDPNRKKGKN